MHRKSGWGRVLKGLASRCGRTAGQLPRRASEIGSTRATDLDSHDNPCLPCAGLATSSRRDVPGPWEVADQGRSPSAGCSYAVTFGPAMVCTRETPPASPAIAPLCLRTRRPRHLDRADGRNCTEPPELLRRQGSTIFDHDVTAFLLVRYCRGCFAWPAGGTIFPA
jgi:hypothetical protein